MLYTIGEMSRLLNIPASTLRYYDQEGLLPSVERSKGGIRMFSDQDYGWLKVIECLKKSGLSIREMKAYTDLAGKGDGSLTQRLELFRSRKDAVKEQIEDMKEILRLLEFKCWYYEQAIQNGTEDSVRSLTPDEVPEQFRLIKKEIDHTWYI